MKNLLNLLLIVSALACNSKENTKEKTQVIISLSVIAETIDLSKKLTPPEIEKLDSGSLRLLRNEIFARKGYKFVSPELEQFFRKFSWYNPQFNREQIGKLLTDIDKYNIELIKEIEKKILSNTDEGFIGYISLIPKVDLPLSFVCEKGFPLADIDYDNELIKMYNPEGAAVIGKLYASNYEVGIIYGYPADIFYPILTKFDNDGNKIGEIYFFELRDCIGDAGYSATTSGTISTDLILKTRTVIIEWDFENEDSPRDTTTFENEIQIN